MQSAFAFRVGVCAGHICARVRGMCECINSMQNCSILLLQNSRMKHKLGTVNHLWSVYNKHSLMKPCVSEYVHRGLNGGTDNAMTPAHHIVKEMSLALTV